MAFGTLILKEKLGVTDRELVEQITENPYLQYFLGLSAYQDKPPFHDSMLTHFRKRFRHKSLEKINEAIALKAKKMPEKAERSPGEDRSHHRPDAFSPNKAHEKTTDLSSESS